MNEPQGIEKFDKMNLNEQFENIVNGISLFRVQINSLQQQMRILEKNVKKEIKTLKNESEKMKKKCNKQPSGIAKPAKVTNELCAFMNKEEGSEIARTDVTKALIEYIEKNKLQFSENKQIIIPDEKLKILLGIVDGQQLTYFTLQKFMNQHFISNSKNIESEKEKEKEKEKGKEKEKEKDY